MKIAIIGAGFTGLSAAYRLVKKGHQVTIFEKDALPGGLAIGYKEKGWDWTIEHHYHHWFTNDKFILSLAKEIHHNVITKRPKTSVYVDGRIFQFDSPKEVLLFPKLSPAERIRMAAVVGLIRYNPFWKILEKSNATSFLPKAMGEKAYKMIWEPQFRNKFGPFAKEVSMAWFWARISKRTPSLAYPEEGFLSFAEHLTKVIEKQGGTFHFSTEVTGIKGGTSPAVSYKAKNGNVQTTVFDKVIFTLPTFIFLKFAEDLPSAYKEQYGKLKGLGATNLILRLRKPFFTNDTYWLSVCDTTAPVMAIVEHTNYMDKKFYNNEHIIYLGNYLPIDSKEYLMDKHEKLTLFDPFLKKINPEYKQHLIGYEVFKAPFAQPIVPPNYSAMIPPMETPLANVYLANMQQVYPWDRGTNYAVELGEKAAALINK